MSMFENEIPDPIEILVGNLAAGDERMARDFVGDVTLETLSGIREGLTAALKLVDRELWLMGTGKVTL